MNLADHTNAMFELGGGIGLLLNCRRLWRDRVVHGVDWRVLGFFGLWGYWNLYYYSGLSQWFSFAAGVVPCAANTAWVLMYLWFRTPNPFERKPERK